MGVTGLKSRAGSTGGSKGESFSCRSWLPGAAAFLGSYPFLHLQSQRWTVESISHCIALTLTLLPPSSTFKDPCDDMEPTQIIQDNPAVLRASDQHYQLHLSP